MSASEASIRAALTRYRVMAWTVGSGLVVLVLVGVPLQFAANNKAVVSVVGPLHGFLYIVYLATALDLARRDRWSLWQLAGAVAAGFVPFLAFFVEHFVSRRVLRELEERRAGIDQKDATPG